MQQATLEVIEARLREERFKSTVVAERYLCGIQRWKDALLDTHGFTGDALSQPALESLYLSESTFVLAVLIHLQKDVVDLPLSGLWGTGELPLVCSTVESLYGWVLSVKADTWLEMNTDGEPKPDVLAGVDPFKDAFEEFIPHRVRHKSGAFLTPNWMATHLLDRLLADICFWRKRFLEPCAGTGAFLVSIAHRIERARINSRITRDQAKEFFRSNFVAIERNPVACLALLANYLSIARAFSQRKVSVKEARGAVLLSDCAEESASPDEIFASRFELPARESFDYIVGNPPWISWETLDRGYRARVAPAWREIGLFNGSGTSKSFSKEDISTFITYVCADRFLKPGGKLSFVVPQAIFQSSMNSRGFRRFEMLGIGRRTPLRVVRVDDMTRISAFKGASARPAILTMIKGEETEYPVEYNVFSRSELEPDSGLSIACMIAEPSDEAQPDSAWSIHSGISGSEDLRKISGKCAYRARAGVFTGGANAAYYLEICRIRNGLAEARTVTERAKRKLPVQDMQIERDFIFPFLRGRDVSKWNADIDPSRSIIVPHTPLTKMAPVDPAQLEAQAPRTLAYFESVKDFLDGRKGLTAMDRANADRGYYAVLRVGGYTFAPYKVVWRYIASEFICAVVGPVDFYGELKVVIPQEKLMMIDFQVEDEAYFVCGVLSSTPYSSAIHNRMISTQISAKIIDSLRVPSFSPFSDLHKEISEYCKEGHRLAAQGEEVVTIRSAIDVLVEKLIDG